MYTFLVIVEDPPSVSPLTKQDVIEGRYISVTCSASPGNPEPSTFFWTNIGLSGSRQEGPILQLPGINRSSSGNYTCTAENNYNNNEKGTSTQSMVINVLCKYHLVLAMYMTHICHML